MATIPRLPGPFFTGREELLQALHEMLCQGQPVIVGGQAGAGKTEVALAYAGCFESEYRLVHWLNAVTPATLQAGVIDLAQQLELPLSQDFSIQFLIQILGGWLAAQRDYLLILDNADNPELVLKMLQARPGGHVLFIAPPGSEEQAGKYIELACLDAEYSARLLLRRSGLLSSEVVQAGPRGELYAEALELAGELEGLPLALDLAGALIAQTHCSVRDYLQRYRRQARAIDKHSGAIETTCHLLFTHLQAAHPSTADLLLMCAFLAPDDIPVELFQKGATEPVSVSREAIQTPSAQDEALEVLLSYGLIKRGADPQMLYMHQTIQAALRAILSPDEQRLWGERVLKTLHSLLPAMTGETLVLCLRYASHIQQIASLSEGWEKDLPEAAQVFTWAATVLYTHAIYQDAISLLKRVLAIWEHTLGNEHPTTLTVLHNLASLYVKQEKYTEAEEAFKRALSARERVLGNEHPDTVLSLSNLGYAYAQQGKQEKAEAFYQKAMSICINALDPEDSVTVSVLYNLALLYMEQRKFSQAETLLQRVYASWEQALGLEHPDTARALHKLAQVYLAQRKWEQAEETYRKACALYENILGWAHPDTIKCFTYLALLYTLQGRLEEMEALRRRMLEMKVKIFGPGHPEIIESLNGLASVYIMQGKYKPAEPLLQRALTISESTLGPENLATAATLMNTAFMHMLQENKEEAIPLLQRIAPSVSEHIHAPDLSEINKVRENLQLLKTLLNDKQLRGRV